ncbi:MAG TPA: hypothetical protein PKY63_03525 [Bacteroidales bacterium]|nr:hypothetical protein [Bacteroidales bacterium]
MKNFQNKNNNSEYFALPDAKAAAAARRCRHFDGVYPAVNTSTPLSVTAGRAQCDSGGALDDSVILIYLLRFLRGKPRVDTSQRCFASPFSPQP